MILFHHTGDRGYILFTKMRDSPLYFIYMSWGMLQTCGVDIFLLISGSLLMRKNDTWQYNLKHRVSRIAIAIVVAELLNYMYQINFNFEDFDITYLIQGIVKRPLVSSHWYLYMYLGFLVMLPAFQRMAKSMQPDLFCYLFIVYLIIYVADAIMWFATAGEMRYYGGNYQGLCTAQNMFVPLMGYWCDRVIDIEEIIKKKVTYLITVLLVLLGIQCSMVDYYCRTSGDWSKGAVEMWYGYFVMPMSMIIFILVKKIVERKAMPVNISSFITTLGCCTFGVYLFEQIYRDITENVYFLLEKSVPTIFATWGWILVAMVVGLFFTWTLRLIPAVRRIM